MDDLQLSDEERELEVALRREGEAERQAFSESRHSRIMDAVRRESVSVPVQGAAQVVAARKNASLGYFLVAAASIAILVTSVAWVVNRGEGPDVVEVPGQQVHDGAHDGKNDGVNDGADELGVEDNADMLASVLLAAEGLFLAAPVDEASDDEAQRQYTDDKIVMADSSPAEQWDDLAHDMEILANVLFDPISNGPISNGEFETP